MKLALAIIVVVASCGAAPQPPVGGSLAGPTVTARLVADTSTLVPGRPFELAVLLEMTPGWHVYWKNPGDSGLPVSVSVKAPDGFRVGEIDWPVPVRFVQPGDIVGYGYTESVLLPFHVEVPERLSSRAPISFTADVRWLACKDVCVPGKSTLGLALPAGEEPQPANVELFSTWRARMPLDAKAAAGAGTATVLGGLDPRTGRGRIAIEIRWAAPAPTHVDFFPEADPALGLSNVAVASDGQHTRVELDAEVFTGQRLASDRLRTLVVATDAGGGRRALPVDVELRTGGASR